jgi:NAD(P)-dependent dehydrogenase (short-subunit alcohol dehydrogenase family)
MSFLRHDHPLAATVAGILDRVRTPRGVDPLGADERCDGKLALVTGASSGLGFATAVHLARRGARVLMADCRDLPEAHRRAVTLAGVDRFEPLPVDLADLDSVERLCADLETRAARIDLLVLNAAVVPTAARRTPQGLDEMFVVNYLSSFVLVRRLLAAGVVAAPGHPTRARIVFVSSEGHRWSEGRSFIELSGPRDPAIGRVLAYYGEYKMLLTTFAWELSRRLSIREQPPGVFALCPGAMNTNIARDVPGWARPLLRGVMGALFQDPQAAAEPVIYLACSRAIERESAVYLHKMVRKRPDPRATDPARGRALWEASEALLADLHR